jgi:hypothetical protein
VYIHQPYDNSKVPGVTAWFGMSFQRNNTWFEQSKAWIRYMRRCHFMLQQGQHVADACYFIGEDTPKMTGIRNPELPPGYDYDYINADVIEHRLKVKDGLLVLPDGMTYRLMVLPPQEIMRPELLQSIKELVTNGGAILGPPPGRSPSMAGYPDCDEKVVALAREIWGTNAKGPERTFGRGEIFNNITLEKALRLMNVVPDVICNDPEILWTHRHSDDADIYFLSNQHDKKTDVQIAFRVKGLAPELWHPDNGRMEKVLQFTAENQHTRLTLTFPPHGSLFVVFRNTPDKNVSAPVQLTAVSEIDFNTPWQVRFPPDWDAPEHIEMDTLVSWPDYPDKGVRYFSGTASYTTTFIMEKDMIRPGNKLILDLGRVEAFAEISLNGHHLDVLWKPPYFIDITEVVKSGENELEVKVTNTWWNRLVGDARYPGGFPGSDYHKPRTFTTHKAWKADDQLLPAGLLGPVKIQVYQKSKQ